MAETLPKRSEIAEKDKWKLEHIFASEADWEQALAAVLARGGTYPQRMGHVAEDPCGAIREKFALMEAMLPVGEYAFLGREADNGDSACQARADKAMQAWVALETQTAFLEPELLEMDDQALAAIAGDPAMADYSEYIRNLRREKPHTLPKEQEQLLAMLGEVTGAPGNIFDMLTNVDIKFPDMVFEDGHTEPLSENNFGQYRESDNRSVRRQAFEHLFETYGKFGTTIAAAYSASVKKDVVMAKARNYPTALAADMDPLEIPREVYDNLIQVMHESLPILQRYLRLRREMLGLDELHMYDLYCPITRDADMSLSYEKAFDLVLEGLKPMGEDYIAKLKEARDGGWIDVFPAENKSSGAFSAGSLAEVHPYVLLNHNDTLDSAFTIAHELGHSMHSYFSNISQPMPKRDYSLFVAEVASTCNEATMMRYLLERFPEKKTQAYLLNYFLEQFRTTCFRQTMFAEFERATHEMAQNGEPLTREALSKVYYDLNKVYYGESCAVDEWIADEWMRIPHFYNAFYVYVYATGLCAAVSLSERILTEGEAAVKDYRKFLSAGCSLPPIEALKLAGVDMSSPEPLRKAMKVFEDTLNRFEEAIRA